MAVEEDSEIVDSTVLTTRDPPWRLALRTKGRLADQSMTARVSGCVWLFSRLAKKRSGKLRFRSQSLALPRPALPP